VSGERYYIGRRHTTDPAGVPRVLDWRAPVSRAFYRASRQEPEGVAVRRRFGWTRLPDGPAQLSGFEDEQLTAGATGEPADGFSWRGLSWRGARSGWCRARRGR
jgi:hypothetical protein